MTNRVARTIITWVLTAAAIVLAATAARLLIWGLP